jgi:dUTPase
MGIKSWIASKSCAPEPATYPVIKKSRSSGQIVLFTAPRTGVRLARGIHASALLGTIQTDYDEPYFDVCDDVIHLQNEKI